MALPQSDTDDPLLKLDSVTSWQRWLGPECCLLQRAQECQGRLASEQLKTIRKLLAGTTFKTLANCYRQTLDLKLPEPPARYLPHCCLPSGERPAPIAPAASDEELKNRALVEQSVALLHGLVHGVLAAAAYRDWTGGARGETQTASGVQEANPQEVFVAEAFSCMAAYQQAWPISDEPTWFSTEPNSYEKPREMGLAAEALGVLHQQGRTINAGGHLALRRLLEYVFREDENEPLFSTPATVLFFNELLRKGQTGPLAASTHEEGAFACYLDPVAMGLTVIDRVMLLSLQNGWRLCRAAAQSRWGDTVGRPSIRLAPGLPGVALLSGGSAGALLACGMYAAAKGTDGLNVDVTASAALDGDDPRFLQPVDPDSIVAKLKVAKERGLRVVLCDRQQVNPDHREDFERLREIVLPAKTIDAAFEHLTGDAQMERALDKYCREQVQAWEEACKNEAHPDRLTHYVEPHYSWLKRGVDKAGLREASELAVESREAKGGEDPADPYEPVAEPADSALVELKKLFQGSRLICVSEDAGSGKTVFTRRLEAFLSSADPAIRRDVFQGRPPLVVRFSTWPESYKDFDRELGERLDGCGPPGGKLSGRDVARWVLDKDKTHLVLILDAMDQILDDAASSGQCKHSKPIAALQTFLEENKWGKRCHVIVTSRKFKVNEEQEGLFHVPGWRFARIDGFDEVQQYEYLKDLRLVGEIPPEELAGDLAERRERCREQLGRIFHNYDDVAELVRAPVVLAIVRGLAEDGGLRPFRTRGELYLQAEDKLTRRAAKKAGLRATSAELVRWRQILSAVAYQMMVEERWDYAVKGASNVARLQRAASARCCERITPQEWADVRAIRDTDRLILDIADDDQFAFKHRGMMEFYCALHLADNDDPGWVKKEMTNGVMTSIRCGDAHLATVTNDGNWYWVWRFAAELPGAVVGGRSETGRFAPEVLAASLSELYRAPESGGRPRELMYRAWHRFEVDARLLRQFQWKDDHGQPLADDALVARGPKLLLPGAAAVMEEFRRPLQELLAPCDEEQISDAERRRRAVARELTDSFVPCPPDVSSAVREHLYYRCANNHPGPDHPTVRWKSEELEQAVVDDLAKLRLPSPEIATWFRNELAAAVTDLTAYRRQQAGALEKRKSELATMQDRLLNAYLAGSVEEAIYKAKSNELKIDSAKAEEALAEMGDTDPARGKMATALFDWTQRAAETWRGSNNAIRREILDAVCLNRTLSDVNLVATKRKPFDVFAEGLDLKKSRGDTI